MHRFNNLRFHSNEGTAAPPSSEANPTDPAGSAAGSAADGAGTGSPAEGSLPAAGGETTTASEAATVDWQARARSFQSRADRAEAELQRARQALAVEQPQAGGGDGPLTMSELSAYLDRRSAIDRVVADIPQRYANAHPQIAQYAYQYESPEALIAALEDSHEQETAYRERIRAQILAENGATTDGAGASAGGDPRPPATGGGSAEAGPPTVQQMAKMTQGQLDAVEKQYPGHLDKALAGMEQDTIFTGT